VSAGPGTQRHLGRGTVLVCERETQTPGIAEELISGKYNYPNEHPPVFRGITPGKINPEKAVYEKFRELLGNLNLAKTRIGELRPLVEWQKKTNPLNYDRTLENQLQEWEETQKDLENDWWVYNFPDPVVRAQEQIRRRFYRTNELEALRNRVGSSLVSFTQGPPPSLIFKDTPEVYEAELAVKAARSREQKSSARQVPPYQGKNRANLGPGGPAHLGGNREGKQSINNRLGVVTSPQKPSWKGPQVQGSSSSNGQSKARPEPVVIIDEGL
jgi:hypothetical protein